MSGDQEILNPKDDARVDEDAIDEDAGESAGQGLTKTDDASLEIPTEVLLSRLESLVFVSPEPISVRRLARILSLEGKRVRELMDVLGKHYENRGIILQEVSKGFQFRSNPDNAGIIRHVFKLRPLKISRAALEALAIVAYRQPLTRAEVEIIRGVDCGGVLKYLFEKQLVRVIGRKEEPGRPIIYGTSQGFLELFGLKTLSDLPALHEFSELWDEHQEIVDEETPLEESPSEEELPSQEPQNPEEAPQQEEETENTGEDNEGSEEQDQDEGETEAEEEIEEAIEEKVEKEGEEAVDEPIDRVSEESGTEDESKEVEDEK